MADLPITPDTTEDQKKIAEQAEQRPLPLPADQPAQAGLVGPPAMTAGTPPPQPAAQAAAMAPPAPAADPNQPHLNPVPPAAPQAVPGAPGASVTHVSRPPDQFMPNGGQPAMAARPQTGVAHLWSKTSNINNPFLRILARTGVAGLGVADVAGSALAPNWEAAIPGSQVNTNIRAARAQGAQAAQSKEQLEAAQAGEAQSRGFAAMHPKAEMSEPVSDGYGGWTSYDKTNNRWTPVPPPATPITNAPPPPPSGQAMTAPNTGGGTPPPGTAMQAPAMSPNAPFGSKLGEKPNPEQNTPMGDAGVPQHLEQLKSMENGMTADQQKQFEQAYSVLPTDTHAVANQRLENAKAVAGMDAKERDLATQRDIAAKNRQTQQGIAAGVHQDAENNLNATRGLESVQYVDKSGNLVSGSYNDAVAAGAEKTARKVSPEDDKTNRANYAQFGRWQNNIKNASETMGAWDNADDKTRAIHVMHDAAIGLHVGTLGVEADDLQNALLNNAQYAAMTPAGQAHMQNMFQLWSDAVNLMKVETGGVPRGEHFLKLESALLPQPEKTQAQNREALNQFSNRILQDAKGHVRPNDMDPIVPYNSLGKIENKKTGQKGYRDASGKDVWY